MGFFTRRTSGADDNRPAGTRMLWRDALLAALAAAVIACALFAVSGLYPLGAKTINTADSWQIYTPGLYAKYDFLHGTNVYRVLQSTYSGGDVFSFIFNILKNPLQWFAFLMPRESLAFYPNIMLLMCIVLSSASAVILLKKCYPENGVWNILLALSYGFSSFIFYNYVISIWYPAMILFPLLVLSLIRLAKKGKGLLYALLLTYYLCNGVQIGIMVLLFTLFSTGIYIFIYADKAQRKAIAYRVGIYTLIGILLSGAELIPSVASILNSSRATYNVGNAASLWKDKGMSQLADKFFMLLTPLPVGLIFAALFRKKLKLKRLSDGVRVESGAAVAMLILLVATVFCQGANRLWHLGSYGMYPIRYCFMIIVVMLLVASEFIRSIYADADLKIEEAAPKNKRKGTARTVILSVLSAALGVAAIIIVIRFRGVLANAHSSYFSISEAAVSIAAALLLCAACALLPSPKKSRQKHDAAPILAGFLVVCFAFMGIYGCIDGVAVQPDYTAEQSIFNDNIGGDSLIRLKEAHSAAQRSYGQNAAVMTMGGNTGIVSSAYTNALTAMGYPSVWTSTVSTGGTLLTDALLRNGYVMGLRECDTTDSLYTFFKDYGDENDGGSFAVYQNDMLLPEAFVTDASAVDAQLFTDAPLQTTNSIYRALSGADEDIVTFFEADAQNGLLTYQIDCGEGAVVYIDPSVAWIQFNVYANGKRLSTMDEFSQYTIHRTLDAGYYTGVVTIALEPLEDELSAEDIVVGALNVDMLTQLCEAYSSRGAEVDFSADGIHVSAYSAEDNGIVFIPIRNISSYNCTVNGKKAEIVSAFGAFCAIAVPKGQSQIVIRSGVDFNRAMGLLVTALGVAVLVLHLLLRRRRGEPCAWWATVVAVTYTVILCVGVSVLCVAPFIAYAIVIGGIAVKLVSGKYLGRISSLLKSIMGG